MLTDRMLRTARNGLPLLSYLVTVCIESDDEEIVEEMARAEACTVSPPPGCSITSRHSITKRHLTRSRHVKETEVALATVAALGADAVCLSEATPLTSSS